MTDRAGVHEASADLLERDAQLELLDRLLAGAQDGNGRVVLVGGEAGIGKTTLLNEFRLRHPETRILWGGCERLFTPRPLGPFADMARLAGSELEDVIGRGTTPYEFFASLVSGLDSGRAKLLVIEDLHWADNGTLDVLKLLARRIDDLPTLVVVSFRDDELGIDHPAQLVLGELAGMRTVERMRLEPLSRRAVAMLAAPYGADEDRLFAQTGGNPFFVTEVLAAGDARIPATVRDAVLARAAHLPLAARRLLESVAASPARVELWLLDAIASDVSPLETCLSSGMLRSEHEDVSFRHELARLAIADSTPPDRRVAIHRAILSALAAPPGGRPDFARLAHHAEAAGDADAVLRFAPQAGERAAALGAHLEAADQYRRALLHADSLPLDEQAELYEQRAYECHLTDQLEAALAAAEEALSRRRLLAQPKREADMLQLMSRILWFHGQTDGALRHGEAALTTLTGLPPGPELARAYDNLACLALLAHRLDDAIERGTRAIELAEEFGDVGTHASALNTVGCAESYDDPEEGRAKLEQSLGMSHEAGLHEHIARAFVNLSSIIAKEREYARAERYIEEGLDYTAERDLGSYRGVLLCMRAQSELEQGRWDAALSFADLAFKEYVIPLARVAAMTVAARVQARRGDPEAQRSLDRAVELSLPEEPQQTCAVAVARAEVAWLGGEPAAIGPATDEAFAIVCAGRDRWLAAELAYWRMKAGIDEPPEPWFAEPFALQLAGECESAAERWRALGCPYEAALALADSDSEPLLHAALAELQRLGAEPAARIVARALRKLGATSIVRGPRASTRENAAQLTRRQLEVLELLGERLTNSEIAARLCVTPKTVEHHVTAILDKLSARSRHDAWAEAIRLGVIERVSER